MTTAIVKTDVRFDGSKSDMFSVSTGHVDKNGRDTGIVFGSFEKWAALTLALNDVDSLRAKLAEYGAKRGFSLDGKPAQTPVVKPAQTPTVHPTIAQRQPVSAQTVQAPVYDQFSAFRVKSASPTPSETVPPAVSGNVEKEVTLDKRDHSLIDGVWYTWIVSDTVASHFRKTRPETVKRLNAGATDKLLAHTIPVIESVAPMVNIPVQATVPDATVHTLTAETSVLAVGPQAFITVRLSDGREVSVIINGVTVEAAEVSVPQIA
jgi:hypothetical protein